MSGAPPGGSGPPPAAPTPASCDVVMKGGITSGVIYPPLVARLAERFRLRNIGGTSAGAIAAAAAAAAQLGRLRGRTGAFAELARLPEELGRRGRRHSVLRELFQPEPRLALHFRVLTAVALRGRLPWRGLRTLWALVRGFPLAAGVAVVPGALAVAAAAEAEGPLRAAGIAAGALPGAVVVALLLAGRFLASLCRELPRNGFGLCSGMPAEEGGPPALTPWLADLLDSLAGRDPAGPPLTFGDLWQARPSPGDRDPYPPEDERAVHLEMTTTCLTLGRPFRLPLTDRRFFFDPVELGRYFPPRVVEWMRTHPRRPARATDPVVDGRVLVAWPEPADLPVVVAARLSSSFPLLLSAIPLWAVDYSLAHNQRVRAAGRNGNGDEEESAAAWLDDTEPGMPAAAEPEGGRLIAERCWFSDGGICSNFPVHLFDRPLPGWPTFGVNLRPFHPEKKGAVFLAATGGGTLEWWTRFPTAGAPGVKGFLGAILGTMQGWRDNLQIGVPGYRDRVAHVSHARDEGGLNLDMPPEVIAELGERGRAAGDAFCRAYDPDSPAGAWPRHRWARFRSTMAVFEEALAELAATYRAGELEQLLTRGPDEPPNAYRMRPEQAADARRVLAELLDVVERWDDLDHGTFARGAPEPHPELRIVPRV